MLSSLVWALVGAAVVVSASRLRVGTLNSPGPGFLPLVAGIVMLTLAIGILVQEWSRRRARRSTPEPVAGAVPGSRLPVALAVAALLAYALLLDPLGYLVTTMLFLLFALRVLGKLRWWTVLTSAVAATGVSYLLFNVWLKVPLRTWPRIF